MTSASDITSLAGGLQSSIDSAMKRLQNELSQEQQKKAAASGKVEEFQQDVRKSTYNHAAFSTNIGVLIKDTSRLNVMSSLAANDPADFYKLKVTSDGDMTLGQVGDAGVRFQLMDKTGKVLADSDEKAGDAYDAYKKLQNGTYAATKGDYTVRISRVAGEKPTEAKNYAFQFTQGAFSKDYDTIARQPEPGTGKAGGKSYLDILRANGGMSANLSLLSSNSALSLLGGSGSGAQRGSLLNALL